MADDDSTSSSAMSLTIVAAVLGGLTCVMLICLLLRACHWRRLKRKRQRQQKDVNERFSIDFLSQRLIESANNTSASRQARSSSIPRRSDASTDTQHSACGTATLALQDHRPTTTTSECVSTNYVNTSIEARQRESALASVSEIARSDSLSSLEVNPNYRPTSSALRNSSSSCSSMATPTLAHARTSPAGNLTQVPSSPHVELSASALERPYMMLDDAPGQDKAAASHDVKQKLRSATLVHDSKSPTAHYQKPRAATMRPQHNAHHTSKTSAGSGPVYDNVDNGSPLHQPRRKSSQQSNSDVFFSSNGMHSGHRRPSPQLLSVGAQANGKNLSIASITPSEMDEEYTDMTSHSSATTNGKKLSIPSVTPSEMDEEYTAMTSLSSTKANGKKLSTVSITPSEMDEEYTAMTSPRKSSAASMASPTATATFSPGHAGQKVPATSSSSILIKTLEQPQLTQPRYQNIRQIAENTTEDTCV